MAKLQIYKCDYPVLRKRTEPVKNIDKEIKRLINDMWETMHTANGVGLAANQVGVALQISVIDTQNDPQGKKLLLINPEIIQMGSGYLFEEEGCLSVPGISAKVKRAKKVKVRYLDLYGNQLEIEGEDLFSRALQHETDHLQGIVFFDRLSLWERWKILNKIRQLKRQGKW